MVCVSRAKDANEHGTQWNKVSSLVPDADVVAKWVGQTAGPQIIFLPGLNIRGLILCMLPLYNVNLLC